MLDYVTTHDDPNAVFDHWVLDGASRANTDDGRAYVRLAQAGGDTTVSLYRDAARTLLVASGTLAGSDTGTVQLAAQNGSGLSGSVEASFATPMDCVLDVFYADDADVLALRRDVTAFLAGGNFADRPGFADPLSRAKRVVDAILAPRLCEGWKADSLRPLADITARFALFFIHDHLSSRADDAAANRASWWRLEALALLPSLRLQMAGRPIRPLTPRVVRA